MEIDPSMLELYLVGVFIGDSAVLVKSFLLYVLLLRLSCTLCGSFFREFITDSLKGFRVCDRLKRCILSVLFVVARVWTDKDDDDTDHDDF